MTREERKRWRRGNIVAGIVFFAVFVVACGLPNWVS